ncbi:hypothetical protein ACJIZ3_018673 [Penstemon smallii]|uniref:MSP domain-containing protein n=1 Tax=Penstemon smallii TaxID=265156 RepID=A0ABD3SZW0_9LAMI
MVPFHPHKLLNIEPQELDFPFELNKNASSTIELSNNTQKRVAFKVMTTNPEKYLVRPKTGIILPISTCVIRVTMLGPKEAPINMQCKDKFLIKSVLATPGATSEDVQNVFNEPGRAVEDFKLKVVYSFPSHPQSSERSGEGSSIDMSTAQEGNLNDSEEVVQEVDNNGVHYGDWLMKIIIIGFIGLIFWFLIMKMLPLIWSFTFLMTMLVMKMINKLVSDSVEDWVVKALLYICSYFISSFFGRKENVSEA